MMSALIIFLIPIAFQVVTEVQEQENLNVQVANNKQLLQNSLPW